MNQLKIALTVAIGLVGSLASATPSPHVCSRAFNLRYALETKLSKKCQDVTDADLQAVRKIELAATNGTLRAADFAGMENLEELVAHQVTNRSMDGVFDSLTNLRVLELDFIGQVVAFGEYKVSLFPKLAKLEVLHLKKVIIGSSVAHHPENFALYPETMSTLTKLRELVIRDANVSYLSFHLFEDLPELELADFTNNRLDFFVGGILEEGKKLRELNLSGNSLKRVSHLTFPGQKVRVFACNVDSKVVDRLRNTIRTTGTVTIETAGCP